MPPTQPDSRAIAIRDIRHLVVCGHPVRPHQNIAYFTARDLVARESLAGDNARIVVLTTRLPEALPLPLDVHVDMLPVFTGLGHGQGARIDRVVFACLFESIRPNTVFHIHDSRHPILIPILRFLRALGIDCRGDGQRRTVAS
jgi:hypothetical protein